MSIQVRIDRFILRISQRFWGQNGVDRSEYADLTIRSPFTKSHVKLAPAAFRVQITLDEF